MERSTGKLVIEESGIFVNTKGIDMIANLKIDNTEPMDAVEDRDICVKCNKSRRYFCYSCCLPMDSIKSFLPFVRLPLKVDIIKHAKEVDGKSTSSHAAILAPNDVKLYIYPNVPDFSNEKVVLVFPNDKALTMDKYFEKCKYSAGENLKFPFDRVVFIDSTWRQTKLILSDPRMKSLPTICLQSHLSLFWRHQKEKPLTYLSTIEAIYYFFVDLHSISEKSEYSGQYDNLLFFFKYTFFKVREVYERKQKIRKENQVNGTLNDQLVLNDVTDE
ncbi:DTW domain-containing protein 1-like protein [Leptotrombidium deliense]|uniref:tRNA-uridine aminocarboxypropyltransferase 1 n=1 Tax=Leptotrombidium deliense TaxID=299467 RepID=A0A443SUR6_9ACAR|nr:DTW domain-containing protein 1-like protein [Leptotrombidium deliense]